MMPAWRPGLVWIVTMAIVFIAAGVTQGQERKHYGRLGELWIPSRLHVQMADDTLVARDTTAAKLTLRVFPLGDVPAMNPSAWLRERADAIGIPPYVRGVSKDQRDLAGIDWGGFVLGTLPRYTAVDSARTEMGRNVGRDTEPQKINNIELSAETATGDSVGVDFTDEDTAAAGAVSGQPSGDAATSWAVVLYVVKKQGYAMELSIAIPDGDAMEIADIQRRWRFKR